MAGHSTYRLNVASLLVLASVLAGAARGDGTRVINRGEYALRLRAMWLGECMANWTGLRTEGLLWQPPFLTDADWGTSPFPERPWITLDLYVYGNPWGADDDTDIEYVYLHALHTRGVNRLTGGAIAEEWTEHINNWVWVSNAAARAMMGVGVKPPMTALAQGLSPAAAQDSSLMIDAQLTTEMFGMLCPGMPERALAMADLPIRTTARGYAAHASQFYAVLYALASQVDPGLSGREQALWLTREARKYIPDSSKSADVIDFVLADFLANGDVQNWESTRDAVYQRYQGNAAANGFQYRTWYESSVNLATGVMALLYGEMDYLRTVQIGTLSGWDSDNGTATMGGVVAFVKGQAFLTEYSALSDNFWITRTRDAMPDYTPPSGADGEDTFAMMAARMLPIVDREVLGAGGRVGATEWLLPPGGAGAGVSGAAAVARSPTQREFARSANWSVRLAGGTVTGSASISGSPEPGYGSGLASLICDGQETDWRGLEEFGTPRAFCSTQRAGGNPGGVAQTFTVMYDRAVEVQTIRFMGGEHFTTGGVQGGWFEGVAAEVFVDGQWVTPTLANAPTSNMGARFAILDFVLSVPVQATAIRVSGMPGGSGAFVTCMELDALASPSPIVMPTFDVSGDGRIGIDDLYRMAAQEADLNADGVADGADAAYLERAVRWRELEGMNVR